MLRLYRTPRAPSNTLLFDTHAYDTFHIHFIIYRSFATIPVLFILFSCRWCARSSLSLFHTWNFWFQRTVNAEFDDIGHPTSNAHNLIFIFQIHDRLRYCAPINLPFKIFFFKSNSIRLYLPFGLSPSLALLHFIFHTGNAAHHAQILHRIVIAFKQNVNILSTIFVYCVVWLDIERVHRTGKWWNRQLETPIAIVENNDF